MTNCPFCKIVNHEKQASVIYEDDRLLGLMDIHPVSAGACLIIPKEHIDHFTDIPDEIASNIMVTAQKIGRRILEEVKPQRIGYVVHGYGVSHAHLNIVPQHGPNDIVPGRVARTDGRQVIFDVEIPEASREELDEIANKLRVY